MGCRGREFFSDNDNTSSSSMSEALLFATMCIIGLPVDVHVKDGSVYSGIFHTASVDRDYGIVLKKARMTKKGKDNTNVGKEGLIDTLVILSGDLVQVVAKGVMLPADGVSGNWTNEDEEAVVHTVPCYDVIASEVEKSPGSLMDKTQDNQLRQAGDDKSDRQTGDCRPKFEIVEEKNADKIQGSGSSHETNMCITAQVEAVEHGRKHMTLKPCINGLSCDDACASVKADDRCQERSISVKSASTTATQGVDISSESLNLPAKSLETCAPKSAKEFKLNPAAKVFSPSFVNPIPATPAVPTVANMACIPNSSPVVTVAAIQPEVGLNNFACRPSMPVKVAQYGNLTAVNAGSGSQFSQPIVGQLAHRAQPLRYAANYTPVLAEPAYLQPSSPAVMVGRSGQLVYVHPVSHDFVHGATAISPVSTRPLLNLNHVQFPKQQGGTVGQAMPVCVPPPVLATGQQAFAVQGHIPLLQPSFPVPRPIPVPGSNGYYAKLH